MRYRPCHSSTRGVPLGPAARAAVVSILALLVLGCTADLPVPVERPSILLLTADGWSAQPPAGATSSSPHSQLGSEVAGWQGTAVVASPEPHASLASIHTGVGVWQHQLLASTMAVERTDIATLAERLTGLGYATRGWIHPSLRRRHLLSEGFAEFQSPSRVARGLPGRLNSTTSPAFHWVHLTPPSGNRSDARELTAAEWSQRVEQRLAQLLGALDSEVRRGLVVVAMGSHGWSPPGLSPLHRSALEVPLVISLPSTVNEPLLADPARPVAASRLWATLIEVAGGRVEPARAPSLFRQLSAPILSEFYFNGGQNYFSLVDGDWQLRWTTRFSSRANVQAGNRSLLRREFLDTQPLFGPTGASPRVQLEPWSEGASAVTDRSQRLQGMAMALERAWLRHTDPWQTPRDVIRETNPRPKKASAERGVEADP